MFFLGKTLGQGVLRHPLTTQLKENADMARPAKTPTEKRSQQLNISLSPVELAQVKGKADTAHTSLTEFVRAAALSKPVTVKQTTAPDFMTRNELRRIGVNLNQIAHTLNAGLGYTPDELMRVCHKLDHLFDQWLEHGSQDRNSRPQL